MGSYENDIAKNSDDINVRHRYAHPNLGVSQQTREARLNTERIFAFSERVWDTSQQAARQGAEMNVMTFPLLAAM